jgi:hypothetical protein
MDAADHIARERLIHHASRLDDAEGHISDFRRTAAHIEARIIKLEIPMKWMVKLLAFIAFGVIGILGTMVANAIGMHVK